MLLGRAMANPLGETTVLPQLSEGRHEAAIKSLMHDKLNCENVQNEENQDDDEKLGF
jgi:hypothetical protein